MSDALPSTKLPHHESMYTFRVQRIVYASPARWIPRSQISVGCDGGVTLYTRVGGRLGGTWSAWFSC